MYILQQDDIIYFPSVEIMTVLATPISNSDKHAYSICVEINGRSTQLSVSSLRQPHAKKERATRLSIALCDMLTDFERIKFLAGKIIKVKEFVTYKRRNVNTRKLVDSQDPSFVEVRPVTIYEEV